MKPNDTLPLDRTVDILTINKNSEWYTKARRKSLENRLSNDMYPILLKYFEKDADEIAAVLDEELKKFIKKKKIVYRPKFGM